MNIARKSAEARGFRKLREHPESLQTLLDTIACGIVTVDGKGRVNFTNNSARRLLGKSRDELIGLPLDSFGRSLMTIDGAPVPPEEQPLVRALAGESVRGEVFAMDRGDGERVSFYVNAVPIQDARGRICGAAADLVDITERTQMQVDREHLLAALRESESRFRMLAESAPVAVFECDGEGCWLYLNPQWVAISGLSVEESLGYGWHRALHPEDSAGVLAKWRRSAAEPGIWRCEFRLLHPTGRTVWVCTLKKAVASAAGNGTRFVGTVEDITARKETDRALRQAKEAAEEASSAKGRFLSIVSHELRTPMTIFMGMVELALAGEIPREQRSYLETAERAAESLLALVEDILLFSGFDELNLEQRPLDLPACVREAVERPAAEASRKGVRFQIAFAPDVPTTLIGDPHRLRQVLFYLADNAVKFTGQGEVILKIELCPDCMRDRESVRISVHDTGIGIQADRLGRLFHPFTLVDDSSTRRHGGTGLGLAISRELVERMGGAIQVQSTPGEGSVFSFFIPLA